MRLEAKELQFFLVDDAVEVEVFDLVAAADADCQVDDLDGPVDGDRPGCCDGCCCDVDEAGYESHSQGSSEYEVRKESERVKSARLVALVLLFTEGEEAEQGGQRKKRAVADGECS